MPELYKNERQYSKGNACKIIATACCVIELGWLKNKKEYFEHDNRLSIVENLHYLNKYTWRLKKLISRLYATSLINPQTQPHSLYAGDA